MDIEKVKAMNISELGLSMRSVNCLGYAGIYTVQDALDKIKTPNDFMQIKKMGKKSADEIYNKFESLGIFLFMSNSISEEEFSNRINLQINEIGLSDSILFKLHKAGIMSVSDLMYKLVTQSDIICIGLTAPEVEAISEIIRTMGLRLGIFDEPISNLGFWGSIGDRLESKYVGIQNLLEAGFRGVLDVLSAEDAVKTGKQLRRAGYLLAGYPGLDDPETCEKLRPYFFAQPLSFIDLSEETAQRLKLALGNNVSLKYFRRPVRMWYSIIQDFDGCCSIAEQLKNLRFPLKGAEDLALGKDEFLQRNTKLYSDFEEIGISKKLYHTLTGKGITSVEQLVTFSANELSAQKIAGESALESIRNALRDGRLLLKNDYILKCEHCDNQFVSNNVDQTICDACEAKKKRVLKISKLEITISGPDYGSYTNLSSGFTLYANMKNTTPDLLKVQLVDFYVVENDKQISPKYYLSGYSFNEEMIMPGTVKSAGKIWDTERFEYSSFLDDVYAILIIKIGAEERKRMYKFVYENDAWVIDDFFTV